MHNEADLSIYKLKDFKDDCLRNLRSQLIHWIIQNKPLKKVECLGKFGVIKMLCNEGNKVSPCFLQILGGDQYCKMEEFRFKNQPGQLILDFIHSKVNYADNI